MKAIAAVIATMRAKGMSDSDILDVVEAMTSVQEDGPILVDAQAERRRAYDRERKSAERLRKSADPLPKVSEVPHTPPNLPNPSPPKTPLKGVKKVPAVVPDNWEVSEDGLAYATERGMDLNTVVEQQNRFKDHSRSKGTKYLDFEAAWRTWVRNWQEWKARPPPSQSYRPQSGFRS